MKFSSLLEHTGNTAFVNESFDINLPLVFVTVYDQDSGDHGRVRLSSLNLKKSPVIPHSLIPFP